jgi:DNA-3-methyladenine glycosylase I
MHRCSWATTSLSIDYHDREWGVPAHDDRRLFEFLILEGAQAGLSWETILKKRKGYRRCFDGFKPKVVARYGRREVASLLRDPSIVRNRKKVESAIDNARAFLRVREDYGSFDAYVWRFVDGRPIVNRWRRLDQIPAKTPEAEAFSKDLARRGFRFVGPTICYAFMQAVGMVNDHAVDCFRHGQIARLPGAASPLQSIPGVGPSIARDLEELGIDSVPDLVGQDPDELYERLCALRGSRIDPCVNYVFRCAVYYAGHRSHDPRLLKWWNWKEPSPGP